MGRKAPEILFTVGDQSRVEVKALTAMGMRSPGDFLRRRQPKKKTVGGKEKPGEGKGKPWQRWERETLTS